MAEREYSETRWLHEMLTGTAQAVFEQQPVDNFEIEFDRDRGADEHDLGKVYTTEITIRVRFAGDVTIRPGRPSLANVVTKLARPVERVTAENGAPVRYSAEHRQVAWELDAEEYRVSCLNGGRVFDVVKKLMPEVEKWPWLMTVGDLSA